MLLKQSKPAQQHVKFEKSNKNSSEDEMSSLRAGMLLQELSQA
jgi:hypothetical protein